MKCFVKEQTNQEKKIEKHKAGNSSRKNLTRLKNILDNFTIESVALEAGFATKSGFYKSFKKLYQTTPSEYFQQKRSN